MQQLIKIDNGFYVGMIFVDDNFVADEISVTKVPLSPDSLVTAGCLPKLIKGTWRNDTSAEAKALFLKHFPMFASTPVAK
jgi:hypothetical protein